MTETLALTAFRAFERGFQTYADVAPALLDGASTNDLFEEFGRTIDMVNARRDQLTDAITHRVTTPSEAVLQSSAPFGFEPASEFGVPGSSRLGIVGKVGFFYGDDDLRVGYTRRAFDNSTAASIEATHRAVLEADSRNVHTKVLRPLFNNSNGTNEEGGTVYAAWNGDGQIPPPSPDGVTFDATANHYVVSGAATLDSGDVDQLIALTTGKGIGSAGEVLLLLANPTDAKAVRSWRAGVANANGAVGSYDFIPSAAMPARLTTEHVEGAVPPDSYNGVKVSGAYGPALLIETPYVPSGWVSLVASGGPDSPANPIGLREHPTELLRGLRLIPGDNNAYPLLNSFYTRGIGVGVRRRSGLATVQIKVSGGYTVPYAYA